MAGFHALSARTLAGEVVKMDKYKGKVVLVENTASLWGTTVRDFTQMNELCEKVTPIHLIYAKKGNDDILNIF